MKSTNDFLKVAFHVLECLQISTDKSDDYHDTVRKYCAFLDKQKQSIEMRIEKKERNNIREIEVILDKIFAMKWIENFKKHFLKYLFQDLCEKIKNEEKSFQFYFSETDLDDFILRNKENMANIETMNKTLSSYVSFLKPLSVKFNEIYKNMYGEHYNLLIGTQTDMLEGFKKKLKEKLQEMNNEIERETENNLVLNVSFLRKIDCFLNKFPLKILDIKVNEVEENLRRFLRKKIDLNQIEKKFNSVIGAKHENKEEMIKEAQILKKFFISVENMKEDCKSVLSYLPPEIREKEFLESYRKRIIEKMESNERKQLLHEKNRIDSNDLIANLVVTMQFKEFLNDEELMKTQTRLKNKLNSLQISQVNEVCDMIRRGEIDIEIIKKQLQESKYFTRQNSNDMQSKELIKELLMDYVKKACEYLKSINDMDLIKLNSEDFRENYKNLNNIKNDLKDFIQDAINEIDQTEKELESHIEEFYKNNLETVEKLLQNFDVKGEEKLANLIKISENLKGLKVTKTIFQEIRNLSMKDILMESIDDYLENWDIDNTRRYLLYVLFYF